MFTIIVCSIRPAEAEKLRNNIEKTIGVPFEFIAYDNRGTGKGICQVYNECAQNARYDNLCFMHEDVEFVTGNWGRTIAEKLAEKDCGVIGFAGGPSKSKSISGWASSARRSVRTNYIQDDNSKSQMRIKNPYNHEFSEVIAMDGLCLFCSRKTWSALRFDDILLKGFHCYDIDFTIASHVAGLHNYVCHTVMVRHFSRGSYDMKWLTESEKLHKKWEDHLPLYLTPVSDTRSRYHEYWNQVDITHTLGKKGIFIEKPMKYIAGYFVTHPLNGRSYRLLGKYIRKRYLERKD